MHSELRLICFDLNKTLIKENTWYNLNRALGISHRQDQALLNKYEQGQITYQEWLDILFKKYQHSGRATEDHIRQIVQQYTYLPGVREAIQYVHHQGYHTALITGAMDILARDVAADLGIHHWRAHHRFIFDLHKLSQITIIGDEQQTKVEQLQEICNEVGISLTQCASVGDGDNDLKLFQATKHGITFEGSPIASHAWRIIKDMSHLSQVV